MPIIQQKKKKYTVQEHWFAPASGGFFSRPATVYFIATSHEGEDSEKAIPLEFSLSVVVVNYHDSQGCFLDIEYREEWWEASHSCPGSFHTFIEKVVVTLPKGDKIYATG